MNVEARLIEFGKSLLEPGQESYYPSATVMHRIREMQENAGAGEAEFAYDMIDGHPCIPDGGLGDLVERLAGSIDRSRRIAEMREAVHALPKTYRLFVEVTYCGYNLSDIPRQPHSACKMMGITGDMFRETKRRLHAWLESRMCLARRAA